jgi:hypothetical protein
VISLLWPGAPPPRSAVRAGWADDLALDPLVRALSLSTRYHSFARSVLVELCVDPQAIAYRQDLLDDLLARPELSAQLETLLPDLGAAALAGTSRWSGEEGVVQIAGRVAELEQYVAAVRSLRDALAAARPAFRAAAWVALGDAVQSTATSEAFRALEQELPALRARLEQAASVTLGINLDAQLRPESATLLSVNSSRFGGPRSLIGRLLGGKEPESGLTSLRHASDRQPFGPDRTLFLDLSHLLEEVTAPVAQALRNFGRTSGAWLATLEQELAFWLGAARLMGTLRNENYILCRAELAPLAERSFAGEGLYNIELALRLRAMGTGGERAAVPNDVRFDEQGRIFVLTGPNRGGKTTYTRAVGLAQVLCQAGLPVPAQAARISPVDAIYTLFPAAETARTGMGRLDEEAESLAAIFRQATPHSLVLINEPLGSTSPREALAIARDLVCGLRLLGARAIVVTHLIDLAHAAEELNALVSGDSLVTALVAGVEATSGEDGTPRTFRITRGLPLERSYASDIAQAHGLQLEQIRATLRQRQAER